ncbi:MAG: alpha/beta fold hydrolase [Candidatus Bipolaricaulota bacterium]|nr:alpha/beta fold hydrolase [Candidatus Bipolaricaulota bacterium]MDW8031745.1 alpha/beta fold hydrolase [Candidatus Bipolaricaulota bacterium]
MTHEQWLHIDGLRIRCLTAGERGPHILLLHGGGIDSASLSWRFTIEALAPYYRVYAPDLPGYGFSDKPKIAYTTEFFIDFVQKLLDALKLSRASLIGLSMGGAIALGVALRAPERVEKLVLIDSYGLQERLQAHFLVWALTRWARLQQNIAVLPMRYSQTVLKLGMQVLTGNPSFITPEILEEVAQWARHPKARRAFAYWLRDEIRWNSVKTNFLGDLGRIEAPVLLIHGERDRIVPVEAARRAQRLFKNAQLHVIPQCGHWAPRERPEEVHRVILEFLKNPSHSI